MICDPAVAEMVGLRTEPPPTGLFGVRSIYCLDGEPVATPQPTFLAEHFSRSSTINDANAGGANITFENDTARPQHVVLVMDFMVEESDSSPASQVDTLRYEGSLSVTTYPIGNTPSQPLFRQIYVPLAPALTVVLESLMVEHIGTVEAATYEGRALGALPDLEPGWGYLVRSSCVAYGSDVSAFGPGEFVAPTMPAGHAAIPTVHWTIMRWSDLSGDG